MTYEFKNMEGDCDECGCELWLGQSAAPHADLCDHCYEMQIINGECSTPKDHPMYKDETMDLNKLMQIAMEIAKEEHQQQQKQPSPYYTAAFELLARSFIRCIPPMQRNSELNESMQEIANDSDFDDDNDKERFSEHMGHAKSLIIDMANEMEKGR